jgi:hypothetical protein
MHPIDPLDHGVDFLNRQRHAEMHGAPGRPTLINPAALQATGYGMEEAMAMNIIPVDERNLENY